jgi:hypothetical protein
VPTDFGPALNVNDFVPTFDAPTLDHVRQVRARGVAMAVRANVFAKIGDSITESASYLHDVGFGWYTLGAYASLEPTIAFFRAYRFVEDINSFNRASVCAMGGWRADAALEGDPNSALRRELALTRPAYALVMYGTNDLDHVAPGSFRATLARIVDIIELGGTIAAISTIPDRLDRSDAAARVPMFNDAIRSLANERHLPLMDYWRAMQPLPRRGIEADGIHPSVYLPIGGGGAACGEFTTEGLRAGYNMRNLVSIVMLDRLRNAR